MEDINENGQLETATTDTAGPVETAEQETPAEKTASATKPGKDGKEGRTFTQEEVNEIVRKRLEKVKIEPREPTEAEKREAELTAKESRLNCMEYLLQNQLPKELLDILDTSSLESFTEKADLLVSLREEREAEKESAEFAKNARLRKARQAIANECKLPFELADRLQGNTSEEMRNDAKYLLQFVKKPPVAPAFTVEPTSYGKQTMQNEKHKPKFYEDFLKGD